MSKHDKKYNKQKRYKYTGGSTIEVQPWEDAVKAYRKLHRFLKEDGMFVEVREREAYEKPSTKKRKKKHKAEMREKGRWLRQEREVGPTKYKKKNKPTNRGKKTTSRMVKKNEE